MKQPMMSATPRHEIAEQEMVPQALKKVEIKELPRKNPNEEVL